MIIRLFFLFFLLGTSPLFAYDPFSNKELDSLEKEFINEINLSNQVLRDPLAVTYLNSLGHRLTHAIQMHPANFFIVSSHEINAFAGPGGYIGIHVPLILATRSEDELAAVMAHELAHVKLHHLYDMIEHEKLMRYPTAASLLAAMALGMINPMLGSGAMAAALSGAAQHSINYTRGHEKEADRIGMQMLAKAGFNPHAMAGFFNKLHEEMRYYDSANIPPILRTHPLDEERIAEAEDRANHLPTAATSDSTTYELFKAYVRYKTTTEPRELMTFYKKNPNQNLLTTRYGLALASLSANNYAEAQSYITPLIEKYPNQPFLTFALAQAELGLHHPGPAMKQLEKIYHANPDSYATLLALSDAYIQSGQTQLAAKLLTRGFRRYPKDVTICTNLAAVESKNHRPGYAYFIQAQCDYLLGKDKLALQRLKVAEKLTKSDAYLKARIEAKREEIKFLKQE